MEGRRAARGASCAECSWPAVCETRRRRIAFERSRTVRAVRAHTRLHTAKRTRSPARFLPPRINHARRSSLPWPPHTTLPLPLSPRTLPPHRVLLDSDFSDTEDHIKPARPVDASPRRRACRACIIADRVGSRNIAESSRAHCQKCTERPAELAHTSHAMIYADMQHGHMCRQEVWRQQQPISYILVLS